MSISLAHCASVDQVADIITKHLKADVFQKLRISLEMCDIAVVS